MSCDLCGGRAICLRRDISFGYDIPYGTIYSALRNVKENFRIAEITIRAPRDKSNKHYHPTIKPMHTDSHHALDHARFETIVAASREDHSSRFN